MKLLRCLLLLLPILLITGTSIAQKKVITGKVIDKNTGEPLAGASVLLEKSKNTAITKQDGSYTISVTPTKNNLVVSFIGYTTQTVSVGNNSVVDISLIQTSSTETEVVVIGYGTQKRANITGAVTKFQDEKLAEAPVSRLDQALQGKLSGVVVQNVSSQAGDDPRISIRGISSINAGGSPLVVVDGQPVPDGLKFVNLADVESVEILKDAASAAIYGSRGASGVILITSKSGKNGKTGYRLSSSIGIKKDYKRYDIMNYDEYMNMLFSEAALKAQDPSITPPTGANIAPDADRAAYVIIHTLFDGHNEDYQARSLKNGTFSNVNVSASGGKDNLKYYFSGAVQNDNGLMNKSSFQLMNFRSKVDVAFSKKVKLSINLNPSYDKKITPSENFTNFARFPSYLNVFHTEKSAAWVRQNPQYADVKAGDYAQPRHFGGQIYSGTMPDGSFWTETVATGPQDGTTQNNPYSSVQGTDIYVKTYRIQGSADLNITLFNGLTFRSLGSMYYNSNNGLNWSNANATGPGLVSKGIYTNGNFINLLSENTLNYTKNFGDHSLNVLVGYTADQTNTLTNQVTGLNFPRDDIRTLNTATSIDASNSSGSTNQIGLTSYLGRVIYSYKNKYLLAASFRRDGSSYFGPGHKWGSFPAVSLGWVATEEKFLNNVSWLSKLKLRASYGASGNNRILDFGYLNLLYAGNYAFGGSNGSLTSGQVSSSTILGNPDITWETTFQTNLGLDVSFLKRRINLTVDVYQSKTDRLLLQQAAQAFTGVPLFWNNLGSLQNRGIEIDLSTINIETKKFRWSTSINFSKTKNKILELGKESFLLNQGERNEVYRNKVGSPLVEYLGFKTDGVWLSQADIDAAKAKGLTASGSLTNVFVPGGLKLVDTNGDGIIDNNDRVVLGNPYPDFTWGISNSIRYKSFDLSFTLQGVQGGQLINGDPNYIEIKKTNRAYNTNRWISPMFPGDGKTPYSSNGFNWLLTDYVVEDASYYALREINFGYVMPHKWAERIGTKSLRFHVSAQNLYYHMASTYRGLNPEARVQTGSYKSSLVDGYQRGSFPIPKTIIFGFDIAF